MRLSHIAIAVKPEEYEDVIKRFKDVLQSEYYEKVLEDQKIKVAILKLENATLEIITPTESGSTIDKFLEKRGNGIHHFALKVESVKDEVNRLKGNGFMFAVEDMKGAKGGNVAFIHPKSTGGFLIELVEDEY
ncbi:MAG: VOC family protein [candidate division WOR-3 bacterium]